MTKAPAIIRVSKVIPAAKLRTLSSTPVEILAACNSNEYYTVDEATLSLRAGGVAYDNNTVTVSYTTGVSETPVTGNSGTFMNQTVGKLVKLLGAAQTVITSTNITGKGLFLTAAGALGTTGTGTVKVDLIVRRHTL